MSGVNGTLLELWEALVEDDESFSSESQPESTIGSLNTWISSGMTILSLQEEKPEVDAQAKPSVGKKWFKLPTRPRANTRILLTETDEASQLESRGVEANTERTREIIAPMHDKKVQEEEPFFGEESTKTQEESTVVDEPVKPPKKVRNSMPPVPVPLRKSRSLDDDVRDTSIGGPHDESIIGRNIPATPASRHREVRDPSYAPETRRKFSLRKEKSFSRKLKTVDEDSSLPSDESFPITLEPRTSPSKKKIGNSRLVAHSQNTKRTGGSKKTKKISTSKSRRSGEDYFRRDNHLPPRHQHRESVRRFTEVDMRRDSHVISRQQPRETTHRPREPVERPREPPRPISRHTSFNSYDRKHAPKSNRYSESLSRTNYHKGIESRPARSSAARLQVKETQRVSNNHYRPTSFESARPPSSSRRMTRSRSARMYGEMERSHFERQNQSYRSDCRKSSNHAREAPVHRGRYSEEWRNPAGYSSRRMHGRRDDSDAYTYYY